LVQIFDTALKDTMTTTPVLPSEALEVGDFQEAAPVPLPPFTIRPATRRRRAKEIQASGQVTIPPTQYLAAILGGGMAELLVYQATLAYYDRPGPHRRSDVLYRETRIILAIDESEARETIEIIFQHRRAEEAEHGVLEMLEDVTDNLSVHLGPRAAALVATKLLDLEEE
jgi:hypothetical protein